MQALIGYEIWYTRDMVPQAENSFCPIASCNFDSRFKLNTVDYYYTIESLSKFVGRSFHQLAGNFSVDL